MKSKFMVTITGNHSANPKNNQYFYVNELIK